MNRVLDELQFYHIISISFKHYIKYTSRSNKKVNVIHNYIKTYINDNSNTQIECKTEINLKCLNATLKKRCDIVVYSNNIPIIVIPTKFICRNYKQNRNNYLENLVGESYLLKLKNPNLQIIPLNIFVKNCNYYDKKGNIKKKEIITKKDTDVYNYIDIFKKCFNIFVTVDYKTNRIKKINNYNNFLNFIISIIS
jgi:hypothetical protein